ncbi:MAG: hypothetical protein ACYC0C_02340 [Devosia sp.]
MKAGTAQKVVLNCISTGIMIRLGFVYRELKVEMRATNDKLRERAELMVAELAGTDAATARRALAEAGGSIKTATVMLIRSVSSNDAERLLTAGKGNLRAALLRCGSISLSHPRPAGAGGPIRRDPRAR